MLINFQETSLRNVRSRAEFLVEILSDSGSLRMLPPRGLQFRQRASRDTALNLRRWYAVFKLSVPF